MSYNGSGTFNLYTPGNPVVTGTTISSTWANNTLSDIATGLSTAVTKNGQTTATAGIGFYAGTVSLPGIYLGTDTATGFYRIGLNNNGYSVNGTKLLDMAAGLLTVVGKVSPSTTGGIVGTTTNNNADAGSYGEYMADTVVAATSGATTGTAQNVTSLALTAGDWDVSGNITFNYNAATTVSVLVGSSSLTSNTDGAVSAQTRVWFNPGVVPQTTTYLPIPTQRYSVASTTNVYLVATASFAVNTLGIGGTIRARRVR